jgi:8-amino-7-oxononanoate synthase
LFRELRRVDSPQGPRIKSAANAFLNFSSNDYLGLANHPALKEAAIKAVEKFGAGAGASRLICGSLAPFHELEEALAAFQKTEAALSFSTGYAPRSAPFARCSARTTSSSRQTRSCLHRGRRAFERRKLRVFAHNDLNDLEDKLKWAEKFVPNAPQRPHRH